jgi:hypothetical protein
MLQACEGKVVTRDGTTAGGARGPGLGFYRERTRGGKGSGMVDHQWPVVAADLDGNQGGGVLIKEKQ